MYKVVVVEDEEIARKGIIFTINWDALNCMIAGEAANGEEGAEVIRRLSPDIIVTDLKMPRMDGVEMIAKLREQGNRAKFIILTAYGDFKYAQSAVKLGVSDYLLKPFLPKELLFRVQAILKRAYPEQERKVFFDTTTVDLEKAIVQRNSESIPLTAKELQLFEKLYENAGRIVTTGFLCQAVCGDYWQGYESTLATHIRHLREKIEENPSKPVALVTVKGIGYRLNIKGVRK